MITFLAILAGLMFLAMGGLCAWLYGKWQMARASTPVQAPAPAPMVFVRGWKPTTPEQWAQAFREWPDSDMRWRALWDLVSHHLETELESGEGLPAEGVAIAQWAGRVQTMLFLRSQLLQLKRGSET